MGQKLSTKYNPEAAIEEARSYLGCKWRHRGRSRYGVDCVGLMLAAVRAGGVEVEDHIGYGREPWKCGLENALEQRFGPLVEGDWQPGDVAMLRWESRPEPGHVGIIASSAQGLTLIHSHSMSSVIEHGIDSHWKRLILGVFRPGREL